MRPSDSPVPETEQKPAESSNLTPSAVETAEANREATTIKAQQEAEMNNPSLNEVLDKDEKVSTLKPGAGVDDGLLKDL